MYGASVRNQCIEINAERNGIRIRGYIGNQNFSKPNKSYQSVFLNGRYVSNTTISSAISRAYASYLMKRTFPFYVLHINVSPQVVDVNVHPNKADVRFADNQIIFGTVYSVISAILDGKSTALNYIVPDEKEEAPVQKEEEKKSISLEDFYNETLDVPVETPTKTLSDTILEKVAIEEEKTERKEFENPVFETKSASTAKQDYGFEQFTLEEAKKEIEISAPAFRAPKNAVENRKGFTPTAEFQSLEETDFITVDENAKRNNKKARP